MNVNKIVSQLKPLLERGDKIKIAALANIDAQSVYLVYQRRYNLVKESNVHKILSVTIDYLKAKPDYVSQLAEKLKGL